MKKLVIVASLLLLVGAAGLYSQIHLTYETHALLPDNINEMQITDYVNPGTTGSDQTWDFSALTNVEDFEGSVSNSYSTETSTSFPNANVLLSEFDNLFYFKLTTDRLEQYGFATANNNVIISYNEPFIKMKYPFTYGDSYSGTFDADYTSCTRNATLTGSYTVEADGFGKLILPNESEFDSTLRVKTFKTYTQHFTDGFEMYIEITSYRWYCVDIRFPLLTLTSVKTTVGANVSTNYQAAYNPIILNPTKITEVTLPKFDLKVYPNPFEGAFSISYTLNNRTHVNIALYDNLGKKVALIADDYQDVGTHTIPYSADKNKLPKGIYYLRSSFDQDVITNKIVQIK